MLRLYNIIKAYDVCHFFLKIGFIALRCTNFYMKIFIKNVQIPVYMGLLT